MTIYPHHSASRTDRPAPGPAHHLVALPDFAGLGRMSATELYEHLSDLEAARQRQLEQTPSVNLDPVSAAHRATLERMLAEIRIALDRVVAGRYGTCRHCGDDIPAERLDLRPWATSCVRCAPQA